MQQATHQTSHKFNQTAMGMLAALAVMGLCAFQLDQAFNTASAGQSSGFDGFTMQNVKSFTTKP